MTKILILNGPPNCGKDTAASFIHDALRDYDCVHEKFSKPLKTIVPAIVGESSMQLEMTKEDVIEQFGLSYRQMQIQVYQKLSEVFSESWLGYAMCSRIEASEDNLFVISDGGRNADIQPVVSRFGVSNICIMQIMREGCSFEGDIRSYISYPGVKTLTINNVNHMTFTREALLNATDFFSE